MKRPQRKSTLNFETMESRCLLSGVTPVLTTASYDKLVKDLKTAVSSAAATNDHHALDSRLERLADRVLYGKEQLLPPWKEAAHSAKLTSASDVHDLQDRLVTTLEEDIHDDVALGLLSFKGSGTLPGSGVGSPFDLPSQFVDGAPFSMSGTNFLQDYSDNPPSSTAPPFQLGVQTLNGSNGVKLTITTVIDNDSPGDPEWIDMDFENPGSTPTLAGDPTSPWEAGPIGMFMGNGTGIQLTREIWFYNAFCYFTMDGSPVAVAAGTNDYGLYAGANPIVQDRVGNLATVFLFSGFTSEETSNYQLNLGSGIVSQNPNVSPDSYMTFLTNLGLQNDNVNGLHIDFLAY